MVTLLMTVVASRRNVWNGAMARGRSSGFSCLTAGPSPSSRERSQREMLVRCAGEDLLESFLKKGTITQQLHLLPPQRDSIPHQKPFCPSIIEIFLLKAFQRSCLIIYIPIM